MKKEDFYSSTEAGDLFHVSRPTLLKWIDEGKIPSKEVRKVGTRSLIRKEFVDQKVADFNSGKINSLP